MRIKKCVTGICHKNVVKTSVDLVAIKQEIHKTCEAFLELTTQNEQLRAEIKEKEALLNTLKFWLKE